MNLTEPEVRVDYRSWLKLCGEASTFYGFNGFTGSPHDWVKAAFVILNPPPVSNHHGAIRSPEFLSGIRITLNTLAKNPEACAALESVWLLMPSLIGEPRRGLLTAEQAHRRRLILAPLVAPFTPRGMPALAPVGERVRVTPKERYRPPVRAVLGRPKS